MTQEEKAKAYDEALKEIRELISLLKESDAITDNGIIESNLQRIFPQLRESEDERIRKDIITAVEMYKDFTQGRKEEIYAYLEKQKEQKPVEWKINGNSIPTENQVVDISPVEWSEEDEKMVYQVLCYLDPTITRAKREEIELWLKSLLERFNLQPKQERDEEDERVRKWLLEYFYIHRDDLRCASVTSMEILSFLDRHPGKGGACDVDDFSLTLRNCLSADSELTDEQADTFARAYGEDLYKVALGEMKSGADRYDIEEYRNEVKFNLKP